MFFSRKLDALTLLAICFVAFWWQLGSLGLIDPDEPFYAQTAREMVQTGDWVTPQIYGAPQFEKPIFYYWLVAGSFKAFGESEFSGRLPASIFATLLVFLVWAFSSRVWNARAGFLSALVLATGLEYSVMSRLMLTDIPLATFITGAIFCYWLAIREPQKKDQWIFWHFVCAGLAVLTKGPLGSLVTIMATVVFSWSTGRQMLFRGRGLWTGLLAYAVIVVPWYATMFAWHAKPFWDEFFIRDNWYRVLRAEHPSNNHWWYYVGLLFLGSLPWMPAIALTVRRACFRIRHDEAAFFQWCWLLTSLIFLTICQSKIPSYAFYLFVPLAIIVGKTLDDFLSNGFASNGERRMVLGTAVFQCAVVGIFAALTLTEPAIDPTSSWLANKAVSLNKTLRPFDAPILLVFAGLAASMVFFFLKKYSAWIMVSSTAGLALLVGALTIARPAVEAESSARPVALALLKMRQNNEPILTGKFLSRGIIYYTHADVTAPEPAVQILAKNPQPFWAKHPIPVVLWKTKKATNPAIDLAKFLEKHPVVLCTLRKSEWRTLSKEPAFKDQDGYAEIGENIVVRAIRPASPEAVK